MGRAELAAFRIWPRAGYLNWIRRRILIWALRIYFADEDRRVRERNLTAHEILILRHMEVDPQAKYARSAIYRILAPASPSKLSKALVSLRHRGIIEKLGLHYVALTAQHQETLRHG